MSGPGRETILSVFTVFNEIGIIHQLASTAFTRVLPQDLSLAGFGVLNHFARLGGEGSPARLAAAFQVTKGAMTNTLGRLHAAGYVAIRPDPEDRRAKRVSVTSEGLKARNDAIFAMVPVLEEIVDTLSIEEFRAALPFLQELRGYLDKARNSRDFPEDA